ncbi:hypothetical protein BSKO_08231 [Bryopsis sp. KO-2023]|nr:hypothetical protein BSKO_08231 [Bryopsis sp. KO-2023]
MEGRVTSEDALIQDELRRHSYGILSHLKERELDERGKVKRFVLRAMELQEASQRLDCADVLIRGFRRGAFDPVSLKRELIYHRLLKHNWLARLKRVFLTDSFLCVVLEYVRDGTLMKRVKDVGGLPEQTARWLFQQAICAVQFCHSRGLAHRDVRLEKFLLTVVSSVPTLTLCNFGITYRADFDTDTRPLLGKQKGYTAPEVVAYTLGKLASYDGCKADMWSCGICLYVMLYNKLPDSVSPVRLDGWLRDEDMLPSSADLDGQLECPAERSHDGVEISKAAIGVLRALLRADPKQRMSMEEIWSNPWFLEELPGGLLDYSKRIMEEQKQKVDDDAESIDSFVDLLDEAAMG